MISNNKNEAFFSKSDTTFFKGLSIILIVIHNYTHLINGFQIENEFWFDTDNIHKFFSKLGSLNLMVSLSGFFSFFGHYGVQIFFFFSAYGLTIQYAKWKGSDLHFILKRLKKVYLLMSIAVVFCIIFYKSIGISFGFLGTLARVSIFFSTINGFTSTSILSGPFWFFAVIVHFYILFPFLYRFVTKFKITYIYIPISISLLLVYLIYFYLDGLNFKIINQTIELSVFKTIFCHLPELILGIIMAHFKRILFPSVVIVISLFIYFGSQFSIYLFPLSFLSMTIILVSIFTQLGRYSIKAFKKIIMYIGNISMILFILNGPFRASPIFMEQNGDLKPQSFFLFLVLLFILSYLIFLLYTFLLKKLKI